MSKSGQAEFPLQKLLIDFIIIRTFYTIVSVDYLKPGTRHDAFFSVRKIAEYFKPLSLKVDYMSGMVSLLKMFSAHS